MTLLSASDLNEIKSVVNEIVSDISINTTIKYRQYTGEDYYLPTEQRYTNPYTDWSGVSTIMGVVTREEIERYPNVQAGFTKFVFMQSSVSNALSTSDVVVESGSTYNVREVRLDPLEIAYVVFGETV